MSFEHFNLHEEVFNGLRDMGFEKPTPIQESCIPIIMAGRDVLASAQTGTGKTAAFAIPVLEKLSEKKKQKKEGIRALVITPTRELAGQVDEAFFAIGYHTGLTTAKVYGGDDWSRQEKALSRGTNIIVATPGRLLDHMRIHDVDFSNLDFLILDEADRMLDMGFIPDITQIVSTLPKKRQTLLFSATLPSKIVQLAKKMMNNPERVNMAPENKAVEGVSQGMYYVEEQDKLPLVLHLYEKENWASAIIFMSTKRAVDKLTRELSRKGANVTSIHGDRSQTEREKALASFRKGEYRIIVATDVMARGIDVEGVSHVINFSVPHDVEDYVHRIGRTARAEATGDALTLISGQDRRYMESIIRAMESKIIKLEIPESISQKGDREKGGSARRADRRGRTAKPKKGQDDPSKGKPKPVDKSADSGESDEKTPDEKTTGGKASQSKPTSDKESTPRPQRRRGRKRPGGNRRTAKGPGKDAGAGPDTGSQPKSKQVSGDEPGSDTGQDSKAGQDSKGARRRRKPQRRKQAKGEKSDKSSDKSDDATRQKGGRQGGGRQPGKSKRSSTGRKAGPRVKKQPSRKDVERKELFDNITSPDMERVNKSVEKQGGVWTKIKKIFGSN